ncbi:hypothetical protein KFK09_026787 [Dendrobium nobile]|uniref:RNase H type-1 domain-containing protein n=1 Tax=Dendrobium nobile TaxID=94219 RepID=A0A8T3A913_DENNO|nr:hypothetical protein KFK09_026787 [Dendrobium nobile]
MLLFLPVVTSSLFWLFRFFDGLLVSLLVVFRLPGGVFCGSVGVRGEGGVSYVIHPFGFFGSDGSLQTDQATASLSRPSMVTVLVELDVSKKHPQKIWFGSELMGYFQKVEFENLPTFCSHCRMHGHGINECFRLHPNLRKDKGTSSSNGAQAGGEKLLKDPLDIGEGSGPGSAFQDPLIHNVETVCGSDSLVPNVELGDEPSPPDQLVGFTIEPQQECNLPLTNEWYLVITPNVPNMLVNDATIMVSNGPSLPSNIVPNSSRLLVQDVMLTSKFLPPLDEANWQDAITVHSSDNLKVALILGILILPRLWSLRLDMACPVGPVESNIDAQSFLVDHYHCDAYIDTEMDIMAKCYARTDDALSFSKGHAKRGWALGCKTMLDLAVSLSFKLWFKLRNNDYLWANFMNVKYCGRRHPSLCGYVVRNSKVWKRLYSIKWKVEPFLAWGLGYGTIFFWQDRWINVVAMFSVQLILEKPPSSSIKLNASGTKLDNSLGFGGVLRDHNGSFICGFAGPVDRGFSSRAVLMGVLHGLYMCINLNLIDVVLESDFDFRMLRNLDDYNCSFMEFYTLREIKASLILINCSFSIIPALANASAFGFAFIGCDFNSVMDLDFLLLPPNVKGLLILDRLGFPHIND